MHYTQSDRLQEHLETEHHHSAVSEYLKEIVYGGIDGIVTTFAVVAGFSGASLMGKEMVGLSFGAVLLFGVANLLADGLSMGLGNFLSIRSEQDLFRAAERKERQEVRHNPDEEAEETIDILVHKGFSPEDAGALTALLRKNEDYWVDWMMHHELEMESPLSVNPLWNGLATFVSFLVFGSIPLLPYMWGGLSVEEAFFGACGATLSALVLLGVVRWRVTGQTWWRSIGEVILIGGIAAGVAFGVGVVLGG